MSISSGGGVVRPELYRFRHAVTSAHGDISGVYFLVGTPKEGERVSKTNCIFHFIYLFVFFSYFIWGHIMLHIEYKMSLNVYHLESQG